MGIKYEQFMNSKIWSISNTV